MPRYMMFIKHGEQYRQESVPQGLHEEMGIFVSENLKKGVLINTGGLRPTSEGARIRLSRGKVSVIDGPFTEAKEVVGGYALVEAASREEAIALATRFMDIHRRHWPEFDGTCEVRALDGQDLSAPAEGGAIEAASS